MNNKQIESLKQGQISLALKLKKQHATGLEGRVVLYKSYSEGELLTRKPCKIVKMLTIAFFCFDEKVLK